MKLFYSNAAAKEEIANLEGQITALKAEGESTAGQVAALTADLATANASLATMTAERDEAVTAYETSEKAAALVAADLVAANAKLATFDDAVEAAAQAKFAGLGGQMLEGQSGNDGGELDILAKFESLDSASKIQFFRENKAALKAAELAAKKK